MDLVSITISFTMLYIMPPTCLNSCSNYLHCVPTLFFKPSQLALLLNNHSFQLQFPATHAAPCFIKPSHPSQKHPSKRTTLLFVCLKTRGTLSHFLFISGNLHEVLFPFSDSQQLCQHRKHEWPEY